jgi:site-specific DNA recombinase
MVAAARKRRVGRVAIYARRSRQKEKLGIDVQIERCRERAADAGWEVAAEYADDGRSAYRAAERPQYQQLLRDMAEGRFDAVLVYKADRIARDDNDRRQFERLYEENGLWLVATASGSQWDITTADGQRDFRESIIAAEHYSRQLSERMRDYHRTLAREGRNSGGMRPYGFETDGVTVRVSEARIIQEAARRIIRGESLRAVCRRLNREGHGTASGAPWNPTRLKRMLTAQRYNGKRTVDGGEVPAVWPAILDDETFGTVGALLNDPHRRTVQSTARKHVLSGFVWCSNCGHRLYSHGSGKERVYRCHSGLRGGCGKVSVGARTLEENVVTEAYERTRHRWETPDTDDDRAVDPSAEELAGIDERLREAGQLFAAGQLDPMAFAEASKLLRQRREELSAELKRRPRANDWAALADALEHGLAAPWEDGFDTADLGSWRAIVDAALERAAVKSAGRGVRFTPERVDITWREGARPSNDPVQALRRFNAERIELHDRAADALHRARVSPGAS